MTLTLSPEIGRVLTEAAAAQGRTPEELTEQAVREKYAPPPRESREEKKARIHALMGSMAHLGPSRILEDRAEEVAREEQARQR